MNMLHLAGQDDRAVLLALVEKFHAWGNLQTTADDRAAAIDLLFSGDVQAAAWLIGPRRAPVGYVAVSFGFSIELGGRDAFLDEFFIRESVRGRGMGSQALMTLVPMLRDMGVKALHMEVDHDNPKAMKLYQRAGFKARSEYFLMTRTL
ncbi:GNAT family N-acetyltransferase [Aliiroseovarius sp. YM-037]|uniref:GNAT family N-acetyltransferase n=1 Tax=Aliiroseovarius sp. YM-037 TaxID=3341728 RepID=UPI003A7FD9E4